MQRLRGRLYLQDGAIEPWELSPDNRHQTPADEESWHLLALSPTGQICGCARYREHGHLDPISNLSVAASPLANSDKWEPLLTSAVASEIELARRINYSFVEVGGWALTDEFRRTPEAIKIALAAYSLARILGGCIGITTATVRHSSASILRRIGGERLQSGGVEIPSYYDPRYKCEMVILRFNSSAPNPRYSAWVDELEAVLPFASVVCAPHQVVRKPAFNDSLYPMKARTWPARHANLDTQFTYSAGSPLVPASILHSPFGRYDAVKTNRSGD